MTLMMDMKMIMEESQSFSQMDPIDMYRISMVDESRLHSMALQIETDRMAQTEELAATEMIIRSSISKREVNLGEIITIPSKDPNMQIKKNSK